MTARAKGIKFHLIQASIAMQIETWWNASNEGQTVSWVSRQMQNQLQQGVPYDLCKELDYNLTVMLPRAVNGSLRSCHLSDH